MTSIEIPCSKLSKSVLYRMYGTTTDIKLSTYDNFSKIIYSKSLLKVSEHFIKNVLTETVTILVKDEFVKTIAMSVTRTGKQLHEYHVSMLHFYTHFSEIAGIPIRSSIDKIYETYDICDDEITMDNLLKRHQRFKKNTAFFYKKTGESVLDNYKKMTDIKGRYSYKSYEKLHLIINEYFSTNEKYFYTKKMKFRGSMLLKLRAYVYSEFGNKSVAQIAKKMRTTNVVIYKRIASFQNDLLYLPPIVIPD